jgi:hypothetical protein
LRGAAKESEVQFFSMNVKCEREKKKILSGMNVVDAASHTSIHKNKAQNVNEGNIVNCHDLFVNYVQIAAIKVSFGEWNEAVESKNGIFR